MLPLLRAWKPLFFCGLAFGIPWNIAGQTLTPQGGEYDLVGALPGVQLFPSVSVRADGGFAVWQDNLIDTNGFGIAGQRLDGNFAGVGNKFRINAVQVADQLSPQVALLADGGAIVAWQRERRAANDVVARFLRADGTFLTGDVAVNPGTSNITTITVTNYPGWKTNKFQNVRFTLAEQARRFRERSDSPVVAALPDGTSLVAYSGTRRVSSRSQEVQTRVTYLARRFHTNDVLRPVTNYNDFMRDVFFQRFSAAGQKIGKEVLVNEFASYNQRNPSVAVLSNGNFVVAFVSELVVAKNEFQRNDVAVLARVFDAAGQPLGHEFRVSGTNNLCVNPAVAALPDGRFTVVWSQRDAVRTNGWDIYGRVCSMSGGATGAVARLNTFTSGDQKLPRITALGANQLVAWTSVGQDGAQEGVFGRFLSAGVPVGEEIAINTTTASKQIHPALAADGASRFLAVWSSYTATASAYDLRAQQYATTQPEPLVVPVVPEVVGGGTNVQGAAATSENAGAATTAGIGSASVPDGTAALRVTLSFGEKGQRLYWNAEAGATYQVQASTNLVAWTNLGPTRVATEPNESLTVNVSGPAAFYRLIRVR